MTITTAQLIYAAKVRYGKQVSDIMNRDKMLLDYIGRSTDAVWDGQGSFFSQPVLLEGAQSQGFYGEGEFLPPSQPSAGVSYTCYAKAMAFTLLLTRQAILQLKKGPGAFFSAKEWEVEQNTINLREKMSRAMWGDGMGVLGVLAAVPTVAGGNSTLTFTEDTNMQYFRANAFYDVWAPAYPVTARRRISNMAGGSAGNDATSFDVGWKCLSVNRDARTILLQGDINAGGAGDDPVAGDYVLPMNEGINLNGATGNLASGKEITGLQQGFSTGQFWTSTQGLSYATYPELQSPRDTSGARRPLSPQRLQIMFDKIQVASGVEVNFIGLDHFQFQTLLFGGYQDVQHVSEQIKLGYTVMTWNGKRFFKDRLAPPGKCFLGSFAGVHRVTLADFGPMDDTSMGERTPRKAEYEWAFGQDMNLIYDKPTAGGWIEMLQTS